MKIRNSEGYMDVVAYKAIMNVDREKKAETKSAFRPLVYVCAPFNGDIEGNKKKALVELAKRHIEGEITIEEVERRIWENNNR